MTDTSYFLFMYSFILYCISLLRGVSPSFSANASLCRWFNNGFKQDAVMHSSPGRIYVKSEIGFRAETIYSIISVSCQHGFKCAILGSYSLRKWGNV